MKNNLFRLLALALCLVFICPSAMAQESSYVINQPTHELIASVLGSGKMITAATKLDLDLDAAALGLSEEEAAQLDVLLGALDQATLTCGFGFIEEGVRLTLEGELADEATGNSVDLDAALNLTLDGLSVESNVIPGRRVTAAWETILALCGAGEEEIASFTLGKEALRSLKGTDIEQVLEELATELIPVLEAAAEYAVPYAETIATFVAALPTEVSNDLHEEGYPPTATEIFVTVTPKDLGDLLMQLCDQFEQDTALRQLIDSALTVSAEGATTAQLITELRAAAAEMTDTVPTAVFLGFNEAGVPLYIEASRIDAESGEHLYLGLFGYEDEDGCFIFDFTIGVFDGEGAPYVCIGITGSYAGDPADQNVCALDFLLYAIDEGESVAEVALLYSAVPVEGSELPAYDLTTSYSIFAEDSGTIVSGSTGRIGLTAAGGETSAGTTQVDTYIEEEDSGISTTATAEMLLEPTADGGLTGVYRISESMPYAGISNLAADMLLSSEAYDPAVTAALETLALETISAEEMDALTQEVYATLVNDKLVKALEILPPQVTEMIMEAAQ